MGLATRINWNDGVLFESGGLRYKSRYGVDPTPSGLFQLQDGSSTGQANDVYESTFTITAGSTTEIDLKGGASEKNVLNQTLAFTTVKGIEIVLTTTPASGVSVRFGPQGRTNAAQLWFQAVTANFWTEIRDRFAMFDRATGWAIGASTKVIALHNPGASSVSGWIRVIGVR